MRELVKEGRGAGQMFAVAEEPRVTLTVTVDREDGWLFECARMMGKQVAGGTLEATLEALLGEGTSSLLSGVERDRMVPFDDALDEDAAQRAWEGELARFRDEAEARCEAAFEARARVQVGDAEAGVIGERSAGFSMELDWDGDAERIDAQVQWVAAELARRELALGEVAEAFWKADGWRRLGFATESQYARERLGMSLSAVKAKRALARRARGLPGLREAVDARTLGYEAARLVAVVASAETAEAWMERARERTVKHLREEVDAAQMLGRLGVDPEMVPPSAGTMEEIAAIERRIVTGAAFQPDGSQMFAVEEAGGGEGDAVQRRRLRSRGRVTLTFRVAVGTRRYYRWLERTYVRHGPRAGGFFRYLCLSFIGTWQRPGSGEAYSDVYQRDLYRCTSPVCVRRDVTPHHLLFRSAGGDDSDENVASLCVWCHLQGVHGGSLGVTPPASAMQWRIGRSAHTVVEGRRRVLQSFGRALRAAPADSMDGYLAPDETSP